MVERSAKFTPAQRLAAWTVHLLTASGAVVGVLAIIAIARHEWRYAFLLMGVTLFIDSIDGMLARACRVKEVLPHFDGALLDNIVDYFTYVILPACFLYETHAMPRGWNFISATAITLASAYQFCQTDAKTEDHCFTGFPSYWNVVVFYLFMLHWPGWINLAIVLFLAANVFVPVRYLYPSRTPILRPLNIALTALWGLTVIWAYLNFIYGHDWSLPLYLSLLYIAYYAAMSAYLTRYRPALK